MALRDFRADDIFSDEQLRSPEEVERIVQMWMRTVILDDEAHSKFMPDGWDG